LKAQAVTITSPPFTNLLEIEKSCNLFFVREIRTTARLQPARGLMRGLLE